MHLLKYSVPIQLEGLLMAIGFNSFNHIVMSGVNKCIQVHWL